MSASLHERSNLKKRASPTFYTREVEGETYTIVDGSVKLKDYDS